MNRTRTPVKCIYGKGDRMSEKHFMVKREEICKKAREATQIIFDTIPAGGLRDKSVEEIRKQTRIALESATEGTQHD